MTDKEKCIRIEINNSIDRIVQGVVHPHVERKKLAQTIVKLCNLHIVNNNEVAVAEPRFLQMWRKANELSQSDFEKWCLDSATDC